MRKVNKGLLLLGSMVFISGIAVYAYDFEDDIYYNPKKSNTVKRSSKKTSNYISNFQDQDVDAYNRRGQYYVTPVDTIGTAVANGEDFVYTQAIQNFYNPTIVVDNAELVQDVLNNSYGNVEVVYNFNGIPSFSPYPYPGSYWSLNFGPLSIGFNDPFWWPGYSYGWSPVWGPTWTYAYGNFWYPSWAWSGGWGPSWSWGWAPGPGPAWGWSRPSYDYRPGGRVPVGPRPGWASNTRPGHISRPGMGHYVGVNHHYNPQPGYMNGSQSSRPGNNTRPANGNIHTPSGNFGGNVGDGGHRNPAGGYYGGNSHSSRGEGSVSTRPGTSGTGRPASSTINSNRGHNVDVNKSSGSVSSPSKGYNNNSGSHNSNNSYNSNRSHNSSNSSGSYSAPSRSSGSFGGGSRGGGGHVGGGRGGRR